MNCPACNAKNSMRWTPPRYTCEECGHELTGREYDRGVQSDWDAFLASPPKEEDE